MINKLTNLITIEELYEKGFDDIPALPGIYTIIRPKSMKIEFLQDTTAIKEYKGKSMLFDVVDLKSKFIKSDMNTLYIGKAGGKNNRLRQRIKQLVRYGKMETNNHRGGRAIWQIENSKDLLVGYLICNNPEEMEKVLLIDYLKKYGVLPVANWKIG